MKLSSVSHCSCICLLHESFPFNQKKLHLDFFSFLFFSVFCIPCIQFIANPSVNSLQIFVRSYLPSEMRWQLFSLWVELGHTGLSLSVKPNHLCATEENASVLPISTLRRQFAICILHTCSSSTRCTTKKRHIHDILGRTIFFSVKTLLWW